MLTTSSLGPPDIAAFQTPAVPEGPIRVGSEAHKRLFCRTLLSTFNPYKPAVIDWPKLAKEAQDRLTSLPIWDIAVQTENRASLNVGVFAEGIEDPLLKKAIELNAFEESRHRHVLSNLVEAYGIKLAPEIYRPIVAVVLLFAAIRLFWQPERLAARPVHRPPLLVTLPSGAALGFLAGLSGTGGGIFLSPLIILFGWEDARRTSGIAAAFIVLNSAAGLAGNLASIRYLPVELPILAASVFAGALLGTWLGVSRLPRHRLLQGLAIVLVIAAMKLLLT